MSQLSDEDSPIQPKELALLLAIAGRIDAQSRISARQLDKDRYIYHSYAVLDALSSSCSMFKYIFEVCISNSNDADLMHQIMTSPEGFVGIVSEALFLVSFAFLASYFDNDKRSKDPSKNSNAMGRFIAAAWPYFRDMMKGMKNAYRGWKSAVQIMSIVGGADLKFMIIPVGLVLGLVSVGVRIWIRHLDGKRDAMKSKNVTILKKTITSLTEKDYQLYVNQIQGQTDSERLQGFVVMGLGGLIDSLYLYAGLMGLAALSAPVFTAMAAVSLCYTVACVFSRLYEEYEKQQKLLVTQIECKLALTAKQLESAYADLLKLEKLAEKTPDDLREIQRLRKEIIGLIDRFDNLRKVLKEQSTKSYTTAVLYGVRQGLFSYGVLASLLFMVVAVFSVSAAVFPPILLIACISSGLALIAGVIAYSVRSHYLHLQHAKKDQDEPFHQLIEMRTQIEKHMGDNCAIGSYLSKENFDKSLKNGAHPEGSPRHLFPDWLETLRSLFSGVSKGSNFAIFAGTLFENVAPTDHEHDTPVMLIMTMSSAALFSLVLALRALARGFRNAPLIPVPGQSDEKPPAAVQKTEVSREPDNGIRAPLPKSRSVLHVFSLFNKTPPPSPVDTTPVLNPISNIVRDLS